MTNWHLKHIYNIIYTIFFQHIFRKIYLLPNEMLTLTPTVGFEPTDLSAHLFSGQLAYNHLHTLANHVSFI